MNVTGSGHITNASGDLKRFGDALIINAVMMVVCITVFSILRVKFPLMYSNRVLEGTGPTAEAGSGLSWIWSSWKFTVDEVEQTCGLDSAMFIEFNDLSMHILATLFFPQLIVAALNGSISNDFAVDRLSRIGMANVLSGSWLFWIHAIDVVFVVAVCERYIYKAMERFVIRRMAWLKRMPEPQSTTLLLENIPPELCCDAALREYFCTLFREDEISAVYVVKKAPRLIALLQDIKETENALKQAQFQWKKSGKAKDARPMVRDAMLIQVDAIEHYKSRLKSMSIELMEGKEELLKATENLNSDFYANNGFVTFSHRHQACIVSQLKLKYNTELLIPSFPPDPADVIYEDLQRDYSTTKATSFLGFAFIVGIFFLFLPFVAFSTTLAHLETYQFIPAIKKVLKTNPHVADVVQSVLAPGVLTITMGFVPSVLMMVFYTCFSLKARAWAQHKVQAYYFWFLIIFVVLAHSIGSSLWKRFMEIVGHPPALLEILATTMPEVTHFYLCWMVMQWTTHALNLTRYIQMIKFLGLRAIYELEDARKGAEPEDQESHVVQYSIFVKPELRQLHEVPSKVRSCKGVSDFVNRPQHVDEVLCDCISCFVDQCC